MLTLRHPGVIESSRRFLRREKIAGYLFISPWLIGFAIFYLYPLLDTFYNSFTQYRLFGGPQWIGLQNYQQLFQDPVFAEACLHMLIYVLATTGIFILGGLALALLLQRKFPGNHFFRIVFYLPSLMVGIAIGSMFVQVFNSSDYGLVNTALSVFHIPPINWLNNYNQPIVGLYALIFVCFWFVGTNMLIFIAGLKGISQTYYESARIDGASAWHRFFSITLPLLTPVLLFNMVMTLIGNIQVFDTALIFAGGGSGSVGVAGFGSILGYHNSLSTFLTYLYQEAFIFHNYGFGSAVAIVIFFITLILTAIVLMIFQRFTYYEGEAR
jgi:ABC-type sugar transport system permease subunit